MLNTSRLFLSAAITSLCVVFSAQAATYQLDSDSVNYPLNASDGAEARDNWFGNVFTAQAGAEHITQVDFGVYTTTPNSSASVVLYRVIDPGGDPALGATRVYTQGFTPLTGSGQNWFLQTVSLSTPVHFNPGDRFLVSVFLPNVIAASGQDVYPFLLDKSGTATGTYWDRSLPNSFNLDDLSKAKPINQALEPGGWAPDPGHVIIRAQATTVPEPATIALLGLGGLALVLRRKKQ